MKTPAHLVVFAFAAVALGAAAYTAIKGEPGKGGSATDVVSSVPVLPPAATNGPAGPVINTPAAPEPGTALGEAAPSGLTPSGPVCKVVSYFDQSGSTIATPRPVAAFMLAGTPITGPVDIPGAVRRELGDNVACPQELLNQVQELFNASCFSEDKRRQTAAQNKVAIADVNKRCADMGEALHPRR